ncbi:MAG TPA: FG-GAP-like repeat-containing protein [Lacunisphaera sp.]|nr:FG-GAP-like repeat-containing protein [Lacunisphaera sp.]
MFTLATDQLLAWRSPALIRRCLCAFACWWVATASSGAPPAAAGKLEEAPLAPRSGPRGATLFALMPPAQTGIVTDNQYDDPKMWGEHYQELALGAMGTGVAIGDFDNDGRPDIFIVSKTSSSPCRLFRNLGHWKFEDVTEKAGLNGRPRGGVLDQGLSWLKQAAGQEEAARSDSEAWRQGAVFVDVNNDGWLDIFVCRFNAPNLLYINQGDGTFKEEAVARGLGVVDACGVGAFCDYDRDGWLDVYITTNMLDATKQPNGRRGYLFHNNGNGTFSNVTERAGIYGDTLSHSATWWDYDGDGWPDLYVANDFAGTDRLYHNNRDGTFKDVVGEVVPHTPYSSMGADFGDVDNDGRPDFFVADMAATTHEMDQRGMAYSRALNTTEEGLPQYSRNALYLNTGAGRLREAAFLAGLAATDWTWSVRFEDLDNDGRLDLFVTNGMNREYQNTDLRDRIILAESAAERMRLMKSSPPLAEVHLAYRNLGDLRFEETGAAWGLNQRGVSFGAAFGDLDGDGDLDLVYANYQGGATVLRNDSDSGHRLVVALRGTRSNRFGIGATVRIETASGPQVRTLMVARGYLSSSEPVVHFGLGDDSVVDRLTVDWPSGLSQTFTRVAADRRLTITEPDAPANPTTLAPPPPGQFREVGAATGFAWPARSSARPAAGTQPLLTLSFDHRGPGIAVGDLRGDGHDDVLVGGTAGDPPRLLLAEGDRYVPADASAFASHSVVEDGPALMFDADGDGADDVLLTRAGAGLPAGAAEYQPQLYLNDGRGGFRPAPDALPPLPISAGTVAAADFDRDGRLDLFVGGRLLPGQYPLPARSVLLANRGGHFEDVTDRLAPGLGECGLVTSALWSDVDGDGWPDLLVALEWGAVRYFHNEAGRGFVDRTEQAGFAAAGTGWWTALASADFNGDGRPDFVAGNVGLNTQYHASPGHPALLYSGSFTPGRPPELVEAYYEGDKLYPWRTRKDLGARIPSILQRYTRNNPYAHATLEEIVGADKLAAARRFAATELRSGVFLSQPDGSYRFEPLARLAQIAPCQGLVAGDFDGDGHADICLVQNSHAPLPIVGRFDGGVGQLLRGDGHGHFEPVPVPESGFVVPGDAKGLAVVDRDGDGWPDLLVTRNNATSMAWHNTGVPGRHALAVRLRGPAGNRPAIGARVSLELADGSVQVAEIFAGGGYWSQSAAAAFFGYRDANPPRTVTVRWPDGSTSRHPVSASSATLTLTHP